MALRGWRLVGFAGTLFVYVTGILLLSVVSLNSPSQRRPRTGRFGEFDAFRRNEVNMVAKRQPLRWCQPLRFVGQDHAVQPIVTATTRPHQFQGLPPDYFRAPPAKPFHEIFVADLPDQKPASPPKQQPPHHLKTSTLFDERSVDSHNDINQSKFDRRNQIEKHQQPNNNNNQINNNDEDDSVRVSHEHFIRPNQPPRNNNQPIATNQMPKQKADEVAKPHLIALASFPGSGNTWLRYLLQQVTGIFTGSVYKDFGLLKSGFPAENVNNSSVLVVKTHEYGPKDFAQYAKAILLVRDPDKAILAEFNRQSGGHVGFASPDRYRRTKGRYWQQFVDNKLRAWEQTNTQWAHNFTGAVHIVYYDDLVADVETTLRNVLNFIHFPIDEAMLQCAIARKEGIYRRKKRILTFDPYTPEMHRLLETKKRQVYADLGRTKF